MEFAKINGKLISIVDENQLLNAYAKIRLLNLTIFLISIVILSLLFLFTAKNIVNPLSKLMNFMNEIRASKDKSPTRQIELDGNIEVRALAANFNNMLLDIDGLNDSLLSANTKFYQSKLLNKETELNFLRSQINPHFLYNTLESIKAISNIKGVPEVRDMAKSLAYILRYSIKGMDIVRLKEELDIVKYYIQIQNTRFEGKFETEYFFDDKTLSSYVIKMILQPVVENAIYHGLELKKGKGRLIISGGVDDNGFLVIRVEDNGVGIQPDILSSLLESLENGHPVNRGNDDMPIGLCNVSDRIKFTYGEKYGISIESKVDYGTEVTIKLPYRDYAYV